MSRILKNRENYITQGYNGDVKGGHTGVDVISVTGHGIPDIIAHSAGVVVASVNTKDRDNTATGANSYGNYVQIKHPNNMYTLYAHLKKGSVKVKQGDKVSKGQLLGTMGNSGRTSGTSATTGIHLHFEVRNKDNYVIDPTKYLEDDLPNQSEDFGFKLMYRVHLVDGEWLDWVEASNNETPKYNEYAGLYGKPIDGVQIKLVK